MEFSDPSNGKYDEEFMKDVMVNVVVSLFSLCVSQGGGHFETQLPGYVNIERIAHTVIRTLSC